MAKKQILTLSEGRALEYWDVRTGGDDSTLTVFYHHGSPNIGEPPTPLFEVSAQLGIGWVAHSRPGYGDSTRAEGRSIVSVARDVEELADALGVRRFAVFGHSGGGPHALACAGTMPERVIAAVAISGLAPAGRDCAHVAGSWRWRPRGAVLT